MSERPIAELLFLEAGEAEHEEYWARCRKRRDEYIDNRPRIDTGEGLIHLFQDLDAIYEQCCRESGRTLRKVVIDIEDRFLLLKDPGVPGPFPWEKQS